MIRDQTLGEPFQMDTPLEKFDILTTQFMISQNISNLFFLQFKYNLLNYTYHFINY